MISKNLKTKLIVPVDHGETRVEVESDRALVKINMSDQHLSIYVPSDAAGLYSCYRTELPAELVKILGIEDSGAAKQVYRILNDEATTLDGTMSNEDIPKVEWLGKVELPESSFSGVGVQTECVETPTNGVLVTPTRSNARAMGVFQTPEPPSFVSRNPVGGLFPPTPPPSISPGGTLGQVARDNAYRQLLGNVANQARRIPQKFRSEPFSMTDLAESLEASVDPNYDLVHLRQALSTEYGAANFPDIGNSRIGAAGELFVFELLRALSMPNFTIDNWQSRIRANVRFHRDYQDLRNWSDREISDIMYTDSGVSMEQFLRKHSYNAVSEWEQRDSQTEYLIEVKTTTGPCTTPFFMSKHQYQLMRQHALSSQGNRPRTVFLIMRVYNLLSSNISLEIYVDPWSLKDNTLEFVADPWKVIPPEPRSAVHLHTVDGIYESEEEL